MALIDPFDQDSQSQAPGQAAPTQIGLIDPFDPSYSSAKSAPENTQASNDTSQNNDNPGLVERLAPLISPELQFAGPLIRAGKNFAQGFTPPSQEDLAKNAQEAGAEVPQQRTPLGAQIMSEFADQPHAKMVAYAKSRFPDMPLEEAVKRYGVVNNHIVYVGEDGHLYAEDQPSSAATMIGNSPTLAGNFLGGIAGAAIGGGTSAGAGSIPGAIIGAGLGSGAGSAIRDAIAHYALGQDKSASDVALSAAGNAAIGSAFEGGGQLVGRGILPAVTKLGGKIVDGLGNTFDQIVAKANGVPYEKPVSPDSAVGTADAQSFIQDANKMGMNVSKAEATGNRADIEQEKILRQSPGGSEKFQAADEIRNPQIRQNVQNFLDSIASPDQVPGAAAAVRSAAKGAIKEAMDSRQTAAKPYYDAANTQTISPDSYEELMQNPVIANTWKKVQSDPVYQDALNNVDPSSGAALHAIKTSLDDQISSALNSGERFRASQLINIQKNLLAKMENEISAYGTAKTIFSENSGPVNALENGIVGKIADTGDTQLKNISSILFDTKQSDPRVLQQAKLAIQSKDPEAWNAITRSYLQSQFEGMKMAVQNGASFGKAFATKVMGTQKQRDMLMMALQDNPEAMENFKLIARVMPRLGIAGDLGSPTATRTALLEKLKEPLIGAGTMSALGSIAFGKKDEKGLSLSGAIEGALAGATLGRGYTKFIAFRFLKNSSYLADAVLNPKYAPEMLAIRKMNPNSQEAAAALTTLLERIGAENVNKNFQYMPNQPIPAQQNQQNQNAQQ